ncbi:hypothetical protein PCE1_000679 [Barthelona sp. PCE]
MIISVCSIENSLVCVFNGNLVLINSDQIILWNFSERIINYTRRGAFWSYDPGEYLKLTSQKHISNGYVSFSKRVGRSNEVFCFDFASYDPTAQDSVISGYLIKEEKSSVVEIYQDRIRLLSTRFDYHYNTTIGKVFDYILDTGEIKMLFEATGNFFGLCECVNEHYIKIRGVGTFSFNGERWIITRNKFVIKENETIFFLLDKEEFTIPDEFIMSITNDIALFTNAVYLVTPEAFDEKPYGYKLIDFEKEGIVAKKSCTYKTVRGFGLASFNMTTKIIHHRVYTFDECGEFKVEVNDQDLYDCFMQATYIDFTDCFMRDKPCMLTENLTTIDIRR